MRLDREFVERKRKTIGYALGKHFNPFQHILKMDAGCRECVHNASNTFMMDEALGCARVKVQYGDDDTKIEV